MANSAIVRVQRNTYNVLALNRQCIRIKRGVADDESVGLRGRGKNERPRRVGRRQTESLWATNTGTVIIAALGAIGCGGSFTSAAA